MYLRRHDKKVDGADYGYWSLVESVRTARGPRQRVVANTCLFGTRRQVGKLPCLDKEERIGWEEVSRLISGKPQQDSLFEKKEEPPSWAAVNINQVSVERLLSFGDIYLALLLWQRLGFAEFCKEHMPEGKEAIPWSVMSSILTVARFCAPSSELQIAESWYDKIALEDILGVPTGRVNDDRLYRALDTLLPYKDALCRHLQERYGELFGETFDFLFYDITSTYFEGTAQGNSQAKRGYSRDSRPDCPQVCIGLVTSREGLPIAFEVFDGNRTDVTTTEEMLLIMENKYGKANRIWVMDRGMVSEKNLSSCGSVEPNILSTHLKQCSKSLNRNFLLKNGKRSILESRLKHVQALKAGTKPLCYAAPNGLKRQQYSTGLLFVWRQGLTNSKNRQNREGSGTSRRRSVESDGCLRETAGPQPSLR